MKFLETSLWTDSEQFKEVEFAFQISLHHKNIFASCTIGRLYDFQLFCLHNNSRENQIEIKVLFWVRNWLWIGLAAPRESKKKLFALFLYEKIFLGSIGRCDTRSFHFPTKISISPCALSTLPHFSTVFPFSDGNYIRFGYKKYWISKFFSSRSTKIHSTAEFHSTLPGHNTFSLCLCSESQSPTCVIKYLPLIRLSSLVNFNYCALSDSQSNRGSNETMINTACETDVW